MFYTCSGSMEVRYVFEESAIWSGRGEYADSNLGSDEEEEALSLCDLPIHKKGVLSDECESALRDSNARHSDLQEFDFDFDMGRCGSPAYQACPADDLFHDGRLLPLILLKSWSESNAQFSDGKSSSRGENRLLLNEKLQAWRTELVDSRSSYASCNNSQENCFSVSDIKFCHANSTAPISKSKSKPNQAASLCTTPKPSPPLSLRSKTYGNMKWREIFTLGLMKTPPMKLEEIRLRQGKPFNAAEKQVLQRSVSFNYEESPKLAKSEPTAANFQQSKSKSVRGEETPRYNCCKASVNSVINCSTTNKRTHHGKLTEEG